MILAQSSFSKANRITVYGYTASSYCHISYQNEIMLFIMMISEIPDELVYDVL